VLCALHVQRRASLSIFAQPTAADTGKKNNMDALQEEEEEEEDAFDVLNVRTHSA
jgi:hypothetical protein